MKTVLSRLALLSSIAFVSAMASARAETITFNPTQYYTTYSFANPPALHIKPGDRVITKTVDAGGIDQNGKQVASGVDPLVGPFFVEGAEPGDAIVVTINKLETNRAMAYSGSVLSPYATTPQAIAARVDRENKRLYWTIDKAKNVATLDQADVQPGGISLPLRPMLGCIGVAPARKEAIITQAPGAFGGNMDYPYLGAGARLTLPVFEPGALLLLGDGHARQGEGEVAGTGLETSLDVEFTVELVKKKNLAWPRIETATNVGVLGSARPLLEAFQIATSELQNMLMQDYGYTERGAQTFMGQAAEYTISNVAVPNFTVAATIRKANLPRR